MRQAGAALRVFSMFQASGPDVAGAGSYVNDSALGLYRKHPLIGRVDGPYRIAFDQQEPCGLRPLTSSARARLRLARRFDRPVRGLPVPRAALRQACPELVEGLSVNGWVVLRAGRQQASRPRLSGRPPRCRGRAQMLARRRWRPRSAVARWGRRLLRHSRHARHPRRPRLPPGGCARG